MTTEKWDDIRNELFTPEQQARTNARVEREIMRMNLQKMRSMCGKTQKELAATLKTTQAQLSRIETRNDHLVSTLRAYAEAMGGELEVVVHFGDKSVRLHGV